MSIRGIKEEGLLSCTYWEAIVKAKPFYDKARTTDLRIGVIAALFLTFERSSMKEVQADLEEGKPRNG